MTSELRVLPDTTALARAAVTHIAEVARASIATKRRFSIALAGGATPEPIYRLLATPEFASQVDWNPIHLFWSDERCVPPDHLESNYGMAWRSLIDHIPISMDNVHRILGEVDPLLAADTYEQELKDHFKSARPRFDLMLLGMGEDGHTASIFPVSTAAFERQRLALAVQHPVMNQWRVTLTFPVINAAANVMVVVSGTAKAKALAIARSGMVAPEEVPATGIHPKDGQLIWFCDAAAAGTA